MIPSRTYDRGAVPGSEGGGPASAEVVGEEHQGGARCRRAPASQPSGEKGVFTGKGCCALVIWRRRRVPLRDDCGPAPLDSRELCALHSFPLTPDPRGLPRGAESPRPQGGLIHGWPMSVVRRASGPLAVGLSLDFHAE